MEQIRILQIVPNMDCGGLENFIMNIYRNIDREQVQFDFLVHYERHCFFDDEIEQLGGKIYRFSVREDNDLIKYVKCLNRFFKTHQEYKVVHGHMESLGIFYFLAAKRYGVKVRIAHSHSASTDGTLKGKFKRFLGKATKHGANVRFACSKAAGNFLFGKKKYLVINNAIETQKFIFNFKVRNEMRIRLAVNNLFVVGHIGRFTIEKNHLFLVDIFNEIHKQNMNSVLLLVGDGKLRSRVEEKVRLLGLQSAVRFLGVRCDVSQLYQAMDVFVLPSLFEGLPVVGIEAQAAGLSCIFSDTITNEVNITDLVHFMSLNRPAKDWADSLLAYQNHKERKDTSNELIQAGYDLKVITEQLENFYINPYHKIEEL